MRYDRLNMEQAYWEKPKSRSIGLFTDLRLFTEALKIASERDIITRDQLKEELPQRLQGLLYVEKQSSRGMTDLIRELKSFNWLEAVQSSSKTNGDKYYISEQGKSAYKLFKKSKLEFIRLLTAEMHSLYTIPGWFVHRLWTINHRGQGEVVIPLPPREWRPGSRNWEEKNWTNELESQTRASLEIISKVCPGAFPIRAEIWVKKVKAAWVRLSNLKRRKVAKSSRKEKGKMKTYATRGRLAMSMREAAVKYLFSNYPPNTNSGDFFQGKELLLPRNYMAWCPRLEALELIFYTDVHPRLPGRLIFPTSVFRKSAPIDRFEKLDNIKSPSDDFLFLHRPQWDTIRKNFFDVLVQEHQRAHSRIGSLYVSILDVRDEVCRQLRLSASCFDEFIEKALRETIIPGSRWSISVETDIREDQRPAHRLIRRPVWIDGTPHSLIAVTEINNIKGR